MATSPGWQPQRPPLKVFLTAAATTLGLSYPFYAVVSALRHVGSGDGLTPCNREPCHFQRIFSAGNIPSTFGDHVRVQNGNTSRPVLMTSSLESATVAQRGLPLAREYTIGLGLVAGGYLFQIPKEHNSSEFETAHIFCLFGLCIDNNHWIPYLSLSAKGLHIEILDEYNQAVDRENVSTDGYLQVNSATRDVISAVDECTSALELFQIYSWQFFKGPCVLFQMLFTGFHPSGVEHFPSALKNNSNPEVDWARCAQPAVAESITNPLANSLSAMIYLVAIMCWTCVKILHDWMVLFDVNEVVSLHVGIFSLYFQAIAIGAGFQAAMGATQAFVALDIDGTSDVCFFRMNRIGVTALIASPCLLLANHMQKKRDVFMAIFCGDLLHYRKESVPYQWLRRHTYDSWPGFSGMVADPLLQHEPSTLGSTSGRAQRTKKQPDIQVAEHRRTAATTHNLLLFWANLMFFEVAEVVFAIIPMALASSSIIPFILGFIVHHTAPAQAVQVHTLDPHSRFDAFLSGAYHVLVALTMCGPALFGVYLAWPSIGVLGDMIKHAHATQAEKHGENEMADATQMVSATSLLPRRGSDVEKETLADDCLCQSLESRRMRTFIELLGGVLLVLFWLMNIALLLPPFEVLAGKSQSELLPYFEFWSVGGFWLTLSAFQEVLNSPVLTMLSLWLSLQLCVESESEEEDRLGEEDADSRSMTSTAQELNKRRDEVASWWLTRLFMHRGLPGPRKFLHSVRASPDLARMFGLDPLKDWVTKWIPPPTADVGTRAYFKLRWKRLLTTQNVDKGGEFVMTWEQLIALEQKKYDSEEEKAQRGLSGWRKMAKEVGQKVSKKVGEKVSTVANRPASLPKIAKEVSPSSPSSQSTPLLH